MLYTTPVTWFCKVRENKAKHSWGGKGSLSRKTQKKWKKGQNLMTLLTSFEFVVNPDSFPCLVEMSFFKLLHWSEEWFSKIETCWRKTANRTHGDERNHQIAVIGIGIPVRLEGCGENWKFVSSDNSSWVFFMSVSIEVFSVRLVLCFMRHFKGQAKSMLHILDKLCIQEYLKFLDFFSFLVPFW